MKYALIAFCVFICTVAGAQEKILEFKSSITVNTDRSVDVVEEIKVRAEGNNIQRGIFRDIITTMRNQRGDRQRLTLTVQEVLKDGSSENFVIESNGIYTRVKIGNADVLLNNGDYTYTIKYNLDRQVRFFDGYDEVYWNVTGNDWGFEIDKVLATITLPENATILQQSGYSGPTGATGCDCTFNLESQNSVKYETTGSLNPAEGLTVAVGWQKGIIAPPSQEELDRQAFNDKKGIYYGAIGVLILFGYLMFAWFKVGRDPRRGAIIPRYIPPDGFSPAACRYVLNMDFDAKAFTASIVSMAVKGYLVIDQTSEEYQLKKVSEDDSKLTTGEKKIAENIFHGTKSVTLDNTYDKWIEKAVTDLNHNLEAEFRNANFYKNSLWMIPAILLGIAIVGYILYEARTDNDVIVGLVLVGVFLLFTLVPAVSIFMRAQKSTGFSQYARMVLAGIFIAALIGIPVYLQITFNFFDGGWVEIFLPHLVLIASVIFLNILFFYLMPAPTVVGRKRMDEIEGLRMFMEVAEKNRLNMLNPPDKTPQLFEQLLPFAIALDVENNWGKQFDSIIERAIQNNEYTPTWYVGRSTFHAHTITSSLGSSLSSSLQSSSTPPSSDSSGSGGGGSSGGGGGGGGGGGW